MIGTFCICINIKYYERMYKEIAFVLFLLLFHGLCNIDTNVCWSLPCFFLSVSVYSKVSGSTKAFKRGKQL